MKFNDIFFVFRQIQVLLEEHALIIQQGRKESFGAANLKLSEKILEDIKGLFVVYSINFFIDSFQFAFVSYHHILVHITMLKHPILHSNQVNSSTMHPIPVQLFVFLE